MIDQNSSLLVGHCIYLFMHEYEINHLTNISICSLQTRHDDGTKPVLIINRARVYLAVICQKVEIVIVFICYCSKILGEREEEAHFWLKTWENRRHSLTRDLI